MPIIFGGGLGGAGGGGGLYFRNPPDEFVGPNVAACRTARNTYFAANANSDDLGEFQGNQSLAIILNPTSGDTEYETYLPGDDVGDAYDATKWTDRTDAIVGRAGPTGPQSRIVLYAYINTATAPTVAPTGGTFIQSTGVKTVPTGYTAAPASPPTGQETYRAEAIVNPATDANTVNLVWSIPAELPAYAAATLAAEYADEASVSAAAAAASAALVTSYSGPVAILDAVAFESNNIDLTVGGWRDYDFLQFVPRDSDATTQFSRPATLVPTADLDTVGESRVPINNNDELRVERTATSDVLSLNITGWSGHPATGDVITIYGIRSGVEAGGGGGGGLDQAAVDARVKAGVLDPAETANATAWGVAKGGTGATTAAAGLTALGGLTQAEVDARAVARYTAAEKTKVAGVEAGATADQTAAEVLQLLLTVDGAASGLDADLLDGMTPAEVAALGGGGGGLTQAQVDARITLLAALLDGATFTGNVQGVTPADDDNSTAFATTEFVAEGFDGASFSNLTRRLVLSRLGGGTAASLPLTFLNAFQGVDPIQAATYHQGDTVKVSGNIYQYTANVSASIATSAVAADTRFDNLTEGGTALEWQDEGTDLAEVTSINLVGPGVVGSVSAGVLTITIAGGTTPAPTHSLYVGWSVDTAVDAAEVLAGAESDTSSVTIPTDTGSLYLFVWRSDTDGGDPTEVHIAGGGNARNTFGPASALMAGGVDGQLIVTVGTLNAGVNSGETLRVV